MGRRAGLLALERARRFGERRHESTSEGGHPLQLLSAVRGILG